MHKMARIKAISNPALDDFKLKKDRSLGIRSFEAIPRFCRVAPP